MTCAEAICADCCMVCVDGPESQLSPTPFTNKTPPTADPAETRDDAAQPSYSGTKCSAGMDHVPRGQTEPSPRCRGSSHGGAAFLPSGVSERKEASEREGRAKEGRTFSRAHRRGAQTAGRLQVPRRYVTPDSSRALAIDRAGMEVPPPRRPACRVICSCEPFVRWGCAHLLPAGMEWACRQGKRMGSRRSQTNSTLYDGHQCHSRGQAARQALLEAEVRSDLHALGASRSLL